MQEASTPPFESARNPGYSTQRGREALNMPGLVRQGSLSPQLRSMSGEGPPLSPADKKRNKLGYHRTAVACGHCRRRKIRCIPAFEDQNGRCQNCIRLKKDCHFFPVEQPNTVPGPKRVRKPTEGFVNESETSVSSSPAGGVLRSSSYDQLDQGEGVMDTPPLPQDSPGYQYQQVPRSFSSHGMHYPHPFDPSQHHQQQSEEFIPSPYVSQSPRGYSADAAHAQYYPQYGHPTQGSYASSFASSSLPSTTTALSQESVYPYPQSTPNGLQWGHSPLGARSMSTGETEEYSHGFPQPYRTHTYPSLDRRMTDGMQHMSAPNATYIPMSMETQPGTIPAQFHNPSSYQPMPGGMQQEWSGGAAERHAQISGTSAGVYSSGWYPQQRDDHAHILPSQDRQRERKPG